LPELRHIHKVLLPYRGQLREFSPIDDRLAAVNLTEIRITSGKFVKIKIETSRASGLNRYDFGPVLFWGDQDLVRAAGLEPALLAKADFESAASTIPPRPHNMPLLVAIHARRGSKRQVHLYPTNLTGSSTASWPSRCHIADFPVQSVGQSGQRHQQGGV
jgi:hypothetical protein